MSELEREERETFSNVYVIHALLRVGLCGQGDGGSQSAEASQSQRGETANDARFTRLAQHWARDYMLHQVHRLSDSCEGKRPHHPRML